MDKKTAIAFGKGLPISTKQSVEICSFIRGKTIDESKMLLSGVVDGKVAVPVKRFNKDMGHRKGKIASGRFPKKASQHILDLVKSVESNAKNIGLTTPLIIDEIISNIGSRSWHHGRIRRIKNKRTNIKIVVVEGKKEKPKKIEKKTEENKK
jgi:large subunit ribosomal protein L22